MQIDNCPFCGKPGELIPHGYSDDYCAAGCRNIDCLIQPFATARPKHVPWDKTEQTFHVEWEAAEIEAVNKWNKRA